MKQLDNFQKEMAKIVLRAEILKLSLKGRAEL